MADRLTIVNAARREGGVSAPAGPGPGRGGPDRAPGAARMRPGGRRPGPRLRGASEQPPGGLLFLKLTGPAETVRAAESGFEALVSSLSRSRG